MTTATTLGPRVGRLLLVPGGLEIGVGVSHNVLGTLILLRPRLVAPLVASLGWPTSILTPITPPEQLMVMLAMSLGAGTCWMIVGATLVWHGRGRATHLDVPLLALVLTHQLSFLALLVAFVSFQLPAIVMVVVMVALAAALSQAVRVGR
jgi:hypothetical protein